MEAQKETRCPVKIKMDLKKMDDQLQKHFYGGCQKLLQNQDWEIDPLKLVIKKPFARGAFGSVHTGLYNGQPVAVKVLDFGEDDGARTRAMQREVSVWYKLDHVNVTKCIGATTTVTPRLKSQSSNKELSSNSACVITEYVCGGNLKSYLFKHRERKLPIQVVLRLALDVARGLSYLHSKNVVHRDIKTDNLLLDKNRRVKIAGFGVSRLQASRLSEMTGNTGTHGYMAPEVLEAKPYDKKCDVYSFGICLWEIYCFQKKRNKPPRRSLKNEEKSPFLLEFQEQSLGTGMPYSSCTFSDMSGVVYKSLRPEIPKHYPSALAEIMQRCWDADPGKRPEMEEVVSMLEAIDDKSKPAQGCFCFFM